MSVLRCECAGYLLAATQLDDALLAFRATNNFEEQVVKVEMGSKGNSTGCLWRSFGWVLRCIGTPVPGALEAAAPGGCHTVLCTLPAHCHFAGTIKALRCFTHQHLRGVVAIKGASCASTLLLQTALLLLLLGVAMLLLLLLHAIVIWC